MAETDTLLTTEDRRRIWAALRRGREIYITPDSRAVDCETGEDYGNQIAAQAIVFAGFARWRRDWVIEWKPR